MSTSTPTPTAPTNPAPTHNRPTHVELEQTYTAGNPPPASLPSASEPGLESSPSGPHPSFVPLTGAPGDNNPNAAQRGQSAPAPSSASELASLKIELRNGLRQFPDFPSPGVLFEDIMPIFASDKLHSSLLRALQLQIALALPATATTGAARAVDVIVGLESRGFLFGPTLALHLGAGFVPVRKRGKLPGDCATETFKKEYGEDVFQMQSDAIKPGQRVIIVDDIIATGGSAEAAGRLVRKLGGELVAYVFLMELDFLKGRERLDAPVITLLSGQEEKLGTGPPSGGTMADEAGPDKDALDDGVDQRVGIIRCN